MEVVRSHSRRLRVAGLAAGGYALAGGLVSLLGWIAGIPLLTDWEGRGISIKANAALAAIAAGVALLILVLAPSARRWVRTLGAFVLIVGGLTLVEHATGRSLGIDTLLFDEPPGAAATAAPGRMGPPASTSYLLIGTALVLATFGARPRRIAVSIALVVGGVAALSLAGYLYGAQSMYAIPTLTGIAAQTATMIAALAIGVLFALPDQHPVRALREDGTAGMLARRAFPFVMLAPLALGWLRIRGEEAGLYDTAFGVASFVLILTASLAGLLWWSVAIVRGREIAQQRAEEALRERERRLAGQKTALELAVSGAPTEAVLDQIVRTSRAQSEPGTRVGLFVLDDTGRRLRCAASAGLSETFSKAMDGIEIGPGNPSCAIAAYIGETVLVADVELDAPWAPYRALARSEGIRSCWSFPIRSVGGKVLGTLAVYHDRPAEPAPRDLEALGLLAQTAALVLEQRKTVREREAALEALRRGEAQLEADLADTKLLQSLSAELISHEDAETFHEKLLDAAVAIMRSDYASWQLYDPDRDERGELRLVASRGFPPEASKFWEWVRPGSPSACGEALRTQKRVVVPDVETCEFMKDTDATAIYRRAGIRAIQSTPLLARNGRFLGMISTHWRGVHQPTERDLRMMDILARQASDLVERKETEEALKEADRKKDEFLATLAHELRNPLAPMMNALEMTRRSPSEEAAAQARSIMDRQLSQLARLVDDLLDVSRISRNKLELKTERVDLRSLVEEFVASFRSLVDERHQHLTVHVPTTPIFLDADPIRLTQILGNLLHNACKYTPEGGRISLVVEPGEREVLVRVVDTGIGIPPEMLPRVFELFTQVDRSLERSHGGLGIGLNLVKRLVQLHGGDVKASSAGEGRGSEFVLRLPTVPSESAQPKPATPREPRPATGRRILIVDDNRDAAETLAALLRMDGNDAETAFDGREAVEKAAAFGPDVILLDIGLPNMNGYEACRTIREQSNGRDILVIALTGWGQEEDRRKSKEAGFDAHLVKPIEFGKLAALLGSLDDRGDDDVSAVGV